MVDNMDFKEILQDDINNAFLDSSEFAEVHNLNGQEVNIVIDRAKASQYGLTTAQVASLVSMANSGSTATEYNGLYKGDKVIYISTEDTKRPPPGNMLVLDNIRYTIVSTTEQCGMYMVVIRKIGVR